MPLVVDQYLPYLEEYDLDLEEKIEVIRTMHTLVEMILDIEESERLPNPASGSQ